MLIIPAIDLLEEKVVRLCKGKKDSCKVYSTDPAKIAQQWKNKGAGLLHIVDLDAAFGQGDNLEIIRHIVQLGIDIQIGGGIRDFEKFAKVLSLGVKRIIISTKAMDKAFLDTAVQSYPVDSLGVSVDVLGTKIMKAGWQEKTNYNFLDFVDYLCNKGIKWIIYTDINRDGTLSGINIENIKKLNKFHTVNFVISGGISSLDNIIAIKKEAPFVKGIIIGKALYENCIDLQEAITTAS